MGPLRWLRRILTDFLGEEEDSAQPATEVARQLTASMAIVALAVAQAERRELELRESLEDPAAEESTIAELTRRLQEDRQAARLLILDHQRRRAEAEQRLERLGQAQRLAALNAEREALRGMLTRAQDGMDEAAVTELEIRARAEAASLDLLDQLEGRTVAPSPKLDEVAPTEARSKAAALLSQRPYDDLLHHDQATGGTGR